MRQGVGAGGDALRGEQDDPARAGEQGDDPRGVAGHHQVSADQQEHRVRRVRQVAGRLGEIRGDRAHAGRDGLDVEAGRVIRLLLDWVERQFRELGRTDADGLALALVGAYQGMSLLTNALRDPSVMDREGARLLAWIDSIGAG